MAGVSNFFGGLSGKAAKGLSGRKKKLDRQDPFAQKRKPAKKKKAVKKRR